MGEVNDRLSKAEAVINAANLDDGTPTYFKALLNSFTFIITELRELNKKFAKHEEIASDLELQKRITDGLQKDNVTLRSKVEKLTDKVDQIEQRGRNINLLLHGVPEKKGENTSQVFADIITAHVTNITTEEIARSHRLGPLNPTPPTTGRVTRNNQPKPDLKPKHRPIIVRFRDEAKKLEVYRNKKKLKGLKMMITENLTKLRFEKYVEAQEAYGKFNVWTVEGRIFCKAENEIFEYE